MLRIPVVQDPKLAVADSMSACEADGPLYELKKAFGECALSAEIDHHLAGGDGDGSRNDYGRKNVTFETGRIELQTPCGRQLITC